MKNITSQYFTKTLIEGARLWALINIIQLEHHILRLLMLLSGLLMYIRINKKWIKVHLRLIVKLFSVISLLFMVKVCKLGNRVVMHIHHILIIKVHFSNRIVMEFNQLLIHFHHIQDHIQHIQHYQCNQFRHHIQ